MFAVNKATHRSRGQGQAARRGSSKEGGIMFARPRAGRMLVLGVLVSAVSLLGLLQAPAWGQPGEKTVGGEAPPPVAAGAAQARGSHAAGAPLSVNVGLSVRESAQLDEV